MTKEMKERIRDIIYYKADEAITQDWIDEKINLCDFVGWMGEAMNCCGEDGVYDAWQEYDKEEALEWYCWLLERKQAIESWDWDYGRQKVIIKKMWE